MNPNTDFIPFARPSIGPEEEEAVLRVMRSGWLVITSYSIHYTKLYDCSASRGA